MDSENIKMNSYNEQLMKIAFDAIKHIDNQHALQEIYRACGKRYAEIYSETVRPVQIGNVIEEDVF